VAGVAYHTIPFIVNIILIFLIVVSEKKMKVNVGAAILFSIILCLIIYRILQTMYYFPSELLNAVKASFLVLPGAFLGVVLNSKYNVTLFIKTYITILVVVSTLTLITYTMFVLLPPQSLQLLSVNWPKTVYTYHLYFPLTFGVGDYHSFILRYPIPRATGIFNEPGVYQMWLLTGLAILDNTDIKIKKITQIKVLFITNILCTFSTVALPVLWFVLLFKYLIGAKRNYLFPLKLALFMLVQIILIYYAFKTDLLQLNTKVFGVNAVRYNNILFSYELLKENLFFGVGWQESEIHLGGVNFLSFIYKVGLVGAGLFVTFYLFSIYRNRDLGSFVIILPILITIMFSQPLYWNGLVFTFLIINFNSLQKKEYSIA